jgi:hypothetical protein
LAETYSVRLGIGLVCVNVSLHVVAPDGASTTTYSYTANTVTTTDPAGNWKKFTMDAFGNLTTVVEPDASQTNTNYQAVAQHSLCSTRTEVAFSWAGTVQAAAGVIIHELLHATVDIFGAAAVSPGWKQNDNTPANQDLNWLTIAIHCGVTY